MAITISFEEQHNYLLLEVAGRLDATNAIVLKKAIDQAIYNCQKHLLLEFSQLESINSDGLKVLYNSRQKLPFIRTLVICQPSSAIVALMELSGVSKLLPIAMDIVEGEMLLHETELAQGYMAQQTASW